MQTKFILFDFIGAPGWFSRFTISQITVVLQLSGGGGSPGLFILKTPFSETKKKVTESVLFCSFVPVYKLISRNHRWKMSLLDL